jgi:hypothetical protein
MSQPDPIIIEWWPITLPKPYERNARRIPESAVSKVAASLREFGWKQPLVVKKDGTIIAGHTRLLAAERLGLDVVPVIVADDLSDAQARAYRLADNRTAQESGWDYSMLNVELEDLAKEIDVTLAGFDSSELSGIDLSVDTAPLDSALGYVVSVTCDSESEVEAVMELLASYGYDAKRR